MSEKNQSIKVNTICPRCDSDNVKSGANIEGREGLHGSNRLPIDSKISVELDNYVCLACGYTETYISNRSMLNRIEKYWHKVAIEQTKS